MNLTSDIKAAYNKACLKAFGFINKNGTVIMLALGAILLTTGLTEVSNAAGLRSRSEAAFDDGLIRGAVGSLFKLIEGAFGALIMVVSGLGAIVAAAMGAYRAAVGMLVVAVGAFILRSLVSLFFGTEFTDAESASGN